MCLCWFTPAGQNSCVMSKAKCVLAIFTFWLRALLQAGRLIYFLMLKAGGGDVQD